jgi:hypothetical protein
MSRVERTAIRVLGFGNPEMDFQLMRSLGAASFRGGEPGEIFAARGAIPDESRLWMAAGVRESGRARARGRLIAA